MNDSSLTNDAPLEQASGRPFYGWWILVVCSLLALFCGSMGTSLTVLVVPMRDDLNLDSLSVGQLIAGGAVAGNLIAVLVGWAADRFGSRPLVLFGGLSAGLGLVLFSQAAGFWHFLLMFAVTSAGVAFGFSMVTLLSMVNRWFSRRRAVAMATLMTMFSLGAAFLPVLVALGLEVLSWRSVLLYTGFFLCAVTVLAWLALRSGPEDKGLKPDGDARLPYAHDFTVRETLRTGAFWALVLAGVVLNDAADSTVENISPLLTAAVSMLAIVLVLGMGVAAARLPARKILSVSLAIGAVGQLGLLDLDNDLMAVTFMVALAVVQGGSAVYWIMAADYYGRSKFGSIMGLIILLRAVGMVPLGVVIALIEVLGLSQFSTVFYLLLYAAAALGLWFAHRPSPPQLSLAEDTEEAV